MNLKRPWPLPDITPISCMYAASTASNLALIFYTQDILLVELTTLNSNYTHENIRYAYNANCKHIMLSCDINKNSKLMPFTSSHLPVSKSEKKAGDECTGNGFPSGLC